MSRVSVCVCACADGLIDGRIPTKPTSHTLRPCHRGFSRSPIGVSHAREPLRVQWPHALSL